MNKFTIASACMMAAILAAVTAYAQDIGADPALANKVEKHYSPYVGRYFPQRVFWGDTHLHTSYSTDAGMAGNTVGPDDAYRFAKGQTVITSTGQKAQLKRPLDFLVITDHAENLGLAPFIKRDDPAVLAHPQSKKWHDMVKGGEGYDAFIEWVAAMNTGKDPLKSEDIPKPRWTAYDQKFYGIKMPEGTKLTVQDRAYTSPIWYTP